MMIAVIDPNAEKLCKYLRSNGLEAMAFHAERVPSLTALLLDEDNITDLVIHVDHQKDWSLGHILAAAKQLQGKGRLVLLGGCQGLPAMLWAVPDKESLVKLLKKTVKSDTSAGGRQIVPDAATKPAQPAVEIKPLHIPSDKILMLGVIGSQRRIGCTTQAIALWHYCKKLGFDAAVVTGTEQLTAIAGSMHHQEIPGGYRIEGIPFVTNTAHSYDCYILDIEPGKVQEALQMTDILVLVAGSKPWELQHTAAALRAARNEEVLVVLSFSSQSDAECLKPLFGKQTAVVAPWIIDLWKPNEETLAVYDNVLRPAVERSLAANELQKENEQQLSKGE